VSRALLYQSKLPKKFWSYAVLHAVYLINRIPTKILNNKSSYEVLYNEVPDLSSLKVFGCLSYASTLPVNRHKFDSRAKKCAFLGYKTGIKGFVLTDIHTSEILISRNVKFFDMEFPFHSSSIIYVLYTQIYVPDKQVEHHELPINSTHDHIVTSGEQHIEDIAPEENDEDESGNNVSFPILPTRKSSRSSQAHAHLAGYDCNSITCHYPMDKFPNYLALSPKCQAYAFSLNTEVEPTSFHAASQDSRWMTTMQAEIEALNANNT
jgi:hypothetical protein